MYYNYIKLSTDLFTLMNSPAGMEYKGTLSTLLDECVYHFLNDHNVPQDRQAEFLSVMFVDCPTIADMYKTKKFTNQ